MQGGNAIFSGQFGAFVTALRSIIGLWLFFTGAVLGAWTPEKWFDAPKSSRIANYRITANLDWPRKTLEGRETITWRNEGFAPTQEFPLHLYMNAFKSPQSLFFKEGGWDGLDSAERLSDPDAWGYCDLREARMEGQNLMGHYGEDETVYWLRLRRPVLPGETIKVDLHWEVRFPRILNRSGWSGRSPQESAFLMGAQWFPKAGVYQGSQWNCHAYHANTEFFADFGVYDVELSVPNALLLAHTGTQTNFKTLEDIPKDPERPDHVVWKLHAEDVHDFAWAAAPLGSWGFEMHEYRGVQVFYYAQPRHQAGLERQRAAVQAALRFSADSFFPYPYPVLSVIGVPEDAEGADGMEYPTLFTAAPGTFEPWGLRGDLYLPKWPYRLKGGPEQVSIHEFGHQYFQGMLASNELEEPWLDEGLTSWFTHKALGRAHQALFSSERFQVGTDFQEHMDYWRSPSMDPITQVGFQAFDYDHYTRSAYAKPVLVLDQLEATLGRPVMERVMAAYTEEMAFRHPTGADFRRIAERVSGRSLDDFWRDFVEGTDVFDVVIHAVGTRDQYLGGWVGAAGAPAFVPPQPTAPSRKGSITLLRRGGVRRPIVLWVRLENRLEHRLTWDGQDRWVTYDFDSPVTAAILDPDGQYPILKDRLHASYTAQPARKGFHYWSQMAWGLLTALLQGIGIG